MNDTTPDRPKSEPDSEEMAGDSRRARSVRFSDSDWETIGHAARERGMTGAEFARHATMDVAKGRCHADTAATTVALAQAPAPVSQRDRDDLSSASSAPRSGTTGTIRVEWNNDLDVAIEQFSLAGNDMRAAVRWRCQRCWGSLITRYEADRGWTGFRCRVCGTTLEGTAATQEYERLQRETTTNLMNLAFGWKPKYDDGVFSKRVRVPLEPQPHEQVIARVRAKSGPAAASRTLTRDEFPLGSAGFLFIQATILMAGVSDVSQPQETFVADFYELEVMHDGTAVLNLPIDELKNDPQPAEHRLIRRMGTTMTEAMIAAFSCELAMKAISLTCNNKASKTHDLLALFRELPDRSRERIQEDYPEIADVIEKGRQTFGHWRYFESRVGEAAIRSMTDVELAHALGKAARVILDEAQFVGISATASVKATRHVRVAGNARFTKGEITLNIEARENPPFGDPS